MSSQGTLSGHLVVISREIATITYRSGPEWDDRFGRKRIVEGSEPSLCPYFMIENYLDHQGESFAMKLDPNTLLYISKVGRFERSVWRGGNALFEGLLVDAEH